MKAKIEKHDKRLQMEVEEEDLSLAQIVRKELLRRPDTAFAGVVKPHPLIPKFIIALETKKRNPIDTLIEGSKKALEQSEELANQIRSLLPKET